MKSQVAIVRCAQYDRQELYQAINKAVNLIGGFASFINKGDRVLLKPNLLAARKPEEAVDTHPEVVRAVIRLTREAGGKVFVGDSPGGSVKVEQVYEVSGIRKICDQESVELVKFDRFREINGVPIARQVLEADKIISIPKLKTHCLMILTGAVKNVFGAVPGMFKSKCHRLHPSVKDLSRLLVDIFSVVRPSISIIDSVAAMEGDGPASGDIRKLGLIIAGADAVALDSIVSALVGLRPFDVPTTKEAYQRKLGEAELKEIEMVGESLQNVKAADFKLPKTPILTRLPAPLLNILAQLIRFKPKINTKICRQCNLCLNSCPAKAIEIRKTGTHTIFCIDYRKCILCLCCNEICPHQAVFIDKNLLAKIYGIL